MSEQWEEIRIEDVQPGDVARCNGREFPVDASCISEWKWQVQISEGNTFGDGWHGFDALGFTFHRRVKREPRTLVGTVQLGGAGTCGVICVSSEYVGVQFVMTELLDGEDWA